MTTNAAPAPGSTTPIAAPEPGSHLSPVVATAPAPAGAPTPSPAPAPAPAAAPTPAPTEPPELVVEGEEGKGGTFTYQPTGDAKLDKALGFMGKHGFGPDHEGIIAAQNGDFSLLRAELAEKGVQGADAYLMLAEAAYETLSAKYTEQRAKDKEALLTAVGGEENWTAITGWAKENASPEEQTEINGMLAKGGLQMKIAAGFLASQYNAATGGLPEGEGSGPAVAVARGAPAPASGALSPQEYGREVAKAQMAHRGREPFEQSKAYGDLRARRMRFRE